MEIRDQRCDVRTVTAMVIAGVLVGVKFHLDSTKEIVVVLRLLSIWFLNSSWINIYTKYFG